MPGYRLLTEVLIGLALFAGCGRSDMRPMVRSAAPDGGSAESGDTAEAASGPCQEATCLTSLFHTCVPQGNCAITGAASPSASSNRRCYANGVTVSGTSGWNGANLYNDLTVSRDGTVCYQIKETHASSNAGSSFLITGAAGKPVATASSEPATGTVVVTCEGGTATEVSTACLHPVEESGACEANAKCP